MGAVAMVIIVILLAWIARLLGRGWIAVALVVLLGAMLASAPGVLGDLVGGAAEIAVTLPSAIARALS